MVAPTLRLAVAIGAMEKRARRTFRRRAATPPETVSGLRRACRHQSHALPRMRRQPALFSRRLEHIGFNMMALMQLGPPLEELYGSARYLFFYMVTGAFGFFVSAATGHFSLGASGALLGLVGLLLAITTKRGGAYMREIRSRLLTQVVILFALGFSGFMAMDNFAHGGGLAAGFLLGKLFADRKPVTAGERRTAYALGWLAGVVIIASFVLMLLHYHDPLPGR